MGPSTEVLESLASEISKESTWTGESPRIEPLIDPETGRWVGLVIVSTVERIGVFWQHQEILGFADVKNIRRAMLRNRVDRAYWYLPGAAPSQPMIELYACLSKIRVIRSRMMGDSLSKM